MSAAINQFGLHTIEYTIRKKRLQDQLYGAAQSESLPENIQLSYAHNTPYDKCFASSSTLNPSIDMVYADKLTKNIWSRPMEESPSIHKLREGEQAESLKPQHTLESNSPYVPYGGFVNPKRQNKWEDIPASPPEISKEQSRNKFPVVLSSMTKYVEEMNTMESGFKLY